jgi:serine/threonine protein kinase
VAVIIKI